MVEVKFLGSGCWEGIPGQFSQNKISKTVEWGQKDFRFRTSIHLVTENKKNIIVEISPDIRLQVWKYNVPIPDAFLVSHWHWDHFFGIKDLDWFFEKNKIPVYANKSCYNVYKKEMNYIPIDFRITKHEEFFQIDNITVTPLTVSHVEETQGFLFKNNLSGEEFFYSSDCFSFSEEIISKVKNCKYIIFDGTFLIDGILEEDKTHLHGKNLFSFLEKIKNTGEIILTNIGSYNNVSHEELVKKFEKYQIAYDGMIFKF